MQKVSIFKNQKILSTFLNREVVFDIVLPPNYENLSNLKVLYMNDGQDFDSLQIEKTLNDLYGSHSIDNFVFVGLHTNENRLKEYGTASIPDYKNRGNMAGEYRNFILTEFFPFIIANYKTSSLSRDNYFCGFSLGGLSAMDLVWGNPDYFSKVGVFSGSFWWRKKAYEDGYDDHNDRIMHVLVRNGNFNVGQKFWFECGTNDEKDDRNGNGIIDSIDDTLDLIKELEAKGYKNGEDVTYVEIKGGEHNQQTWSEAMPLFLKWLLPK
ncbi:esterase [Emticicia oligotrophica DSM 17448]|uniref:Esterase n=1 Tax=Emticicia oligotrophica (strain DSM 17448 / CIP 109782 / MTCC 6937 / GPTSA100-15) TaxID=929562 RepID=A0ABM5N6U9_EMTOG|nr:alpha/beta hydrolase-fold protein [Emticicia oligotrophica]AFK05199.1 esterase [Emticicia oligotrophica DSM 17448]